MGKSNNTEDNNNDDEVPVPVENNKCSCTSLIVLIVACFLALFFIPKYQAQLEKIKVTENQILINGTVSYVTSNYIIVKSEDSSSWIYNTTDKFAINTEVVIKLETLGTPSMDDDYIMSVEEVE